MPSSLGTPMFSWKALVLGASPLGAEMALDLLETPAVSVAVADGPPALASLGARLVGRAEWIQLDLADAAAVGEAVAAFNVVLSAAPGPHALQVLGAVIAADRLVVDASSDPAEAARLDGLAVEREVAACVTGGDRGLARILAAAGRPPGPAPSGARAAAWVATALARRLLSGDFRGQWGVWAPERLGRRVGLAHGILEDLRERGQRGGP